MGGPERPFRGDDGRLSAAICPARFNSSPFFRPLNRNPVEQRNGTRVADTVAMNAAHEKMLEDEIMVARVLMGSGNLEGACVHLERAHVLGQASVRWHVLAHWLMLKIAIRRHRGIAAIGQVVRIVLGAIGSAVGRVPTGNTGGSEVSMFARMPIAPELLNVMEGTELEGRAHGLTAERVK